MTAEAPRRGLGRGLSALLGEVEREQPVSPGATRTPGVQTIAVSSISPNPGQPRRHFDDEALDELAASIAARGMIQPIVVRPHGHGYQIVAGERRWRAAQRAQLHDVPVIVRELTDVQTLELAIIENIQRQDLNVIEEAEAYQKLTSDFGHTQEVLGKLVNKSRSHVANLLRLLELPGPVRDSVASGKLSMGHARALITAPNAEALAEEVIRRDLSVRDTEKLARSNKAGPKPAAAPKGDISPGADIEALQRQLGDILGLKVQIEHGAGGGRVVVGYSTLDQLDLICQRLSGEPI
ncbi:chromosome partitioning protein, ParB family [Sphingomonas sp. YR710]|uniref:ParB/RepB/Spo0J family partition protein n=1 Tax=Sphingomonas sp. YR710 TaxID=1882773 RepID=UPI00088E291D|nr:ParB/RepB/Spo0J family partition protein [Sphingomonas sp. YR710]SDC34028.1 chromosome partitioning protein, ParB family [Sphingomonas sp. YR710]